MRTCFSSSSHAMGQGRTPERHHQPPEMKRQDQKPAWHACACAGRSFAACPGPPEHRPRWGTILAPCRGEFKATGTGRLGEARFSAPLRGTLAVRSAKSGPEPTFFSRATRVSPTPDSRGQLPRRLLRTRGGRVCAQSGPRPSPAAQASSAAPLADSERAFQVRAAHLAEYSHRDTHGSARPSQPSFPVADVAPTRCRSPRGDLSGPSMAPRPAFLTRMEVSH